MMQCRAVAQKHVVREAAWQFLAIAMILLDPIQCSLLALKAASEILERVRLDLILF